MRESTKDYLVLFSGGFDSTVLLYELNARKGRTEAVYFKYGSNSTEQELKHAKMHCEKLGVKLHIIDLTFFTNIEGDFSTLVSGGENVPEGDFSEEIKAQTEVPFRNGVFLSIATSIAKARGIKYVAIATHATLDGVVYADTSEKFIVGMQKAVRLGTNRGVRIYAPYTTITKQDILTKSHELGVDIKDTYSCFVGGEVPCGKCSICIDRQTIIESDSKNEL